MKIRNGFVANSSSSSFVIALKTVPETVEELQQMFFKDHKYFALNDWEDVIYTTRDAAEVLFEDLGREATEEEVMYEFEYDGDDFQYYHKFLNKNQGSKLFVLHYGDEDGGIYAQLEHNYKTFENIPHVRISKH